MSILPSETAGGGVTLRFGLGSATNCVTSPSPSNPICSIVPTSWGCRKDPGMNISCLDSATPAEVSHGRSQVAPTLTSSSPRFPASASFNPFHCESTVWLLSLVAGLSSLNSNFHENYSSQRLQLASYTLHIVGLSWDLFRIISGSSKRALRKLEALSFEKAHSPKYTKPHAPYLHIQMRVCERAHTHAHPNFPFVWGLQP